ncbi:MAG: DUF2934 domain-containing protein [Candidatus Omnitrophota bacterium]
MVRNFFNRKEKAKAKRYSSQDIAKINERAYYVWLSKGKPANSSVSDWLLAEKELKKEGKI